ncbi:hypothetical protein A9G34_04230 [Gilliamella sp. Choc4-2]|nr:hypothetical protein A9G33_02880 [Gilliamella apicola]OCG46730.1 hypothetical protein A9G34_04230 [Gilliamella apicola]OCG56488.1 hypothetical protein A9G36_00255 [Gilliamella apicola]
MRVIMRSNNWTPRKVVSELSQKGIKLDQLIRDNHIDIRNFTDFESCIAKVLDIPLQTIWLSHYDKD